METLSWPVPRYKWIDQIRKDNNNIPSDVWRNAIGCSPTLWPSLAIDAADDDAIAPEVLGAKTVAGL